MYINQRYVYVLMLSACLLLTGAKCALFGSSDGNSSGGGKDTRVEVSDEQKISADSGNFNGELSSGDQFGSAVTGLGDLESDGVKDLAVGAPFDNDGGDDQGAVWILFMDDNGLVDLERKISSKKGGFDGNLNDNDQFGSALAGVGDLNGDGVFDLAVGAPGADSGKKDRGAVWILFLNAVGGVRDEQKIADGAGGFDGNLNDDDRFGSAIADIGDVNGDGITDLAVGAPFDNDGGDEKGAVWILFMRQNGTVDDQQKISSKAGEFDGDLDAEDHFGAAVAGIGDIDNDGIPDLAVGVPGADGDGTDRGAIWILSLNAEGRVRNELKITDGFGGFDGDLNNDDRFGSAIALTGDLNSDGIQDLAVGAPNDDDGSDNAGAVWLLFLKTDGSVDAWQKISKKSGGFNGNLDADDHFGAAVAGIGNLDNSGLADMAVGAPGDDDGGTDKGAVWVLFMQN